MRCCIMLLVGYGMHGWGWGRARSRQERGEGRPFVASSPASGNVGPKDAERRQPVHSGVGVHPSVSMTAGKSACIGRVGGKRSRLGASVVAARVWLRRMRSVSYWGCRGV